MSLDVFRPLGGSPDRPTPPTPPSEEEPAWRYQPDARLQPKSGLERRALFARGDAVVFCAAFFAWVEASERAGRWMDPRQFKCPAAPISGPLARPNEPA